MNVKAILTDLDNTLIHDQMVLPALITAVSNYLNVDSRASEDIISDFFARQPQKLFYLNGYSKSGLWKEVLKRHVKSVHPTTIYECNNIFWETIAENVQPIEGVLNTLKELKQLSYDIYVVSGGDYISRYLQIQKTGILEHIDGLVTTEDFGIKKSEDDLYIKAANYFGLDPLECIVIGDNDVDDIQLPKQNGFVTVRVSRTETSKEAKYTVKSFSDILDILK